METTSDEWTAKIFGAVEAGNVDLLASLASRSQDGARLPQACDGKGNNLWHAAAKHNQGDVLKWLCEFAGQAPVACKNLSHLTPTFLAIKHESLEALEWLAENCVEAKGQLDPRKSVARQTALHFAAKLGKSRSLNWLAKQYLVSGHSINQKDNLGNTALHLAAQNNHLCAIKALLLNGADLLQRNIIGMKAQDVARVNGNAESADYLVAFECCLGMAKETVALENDLASIRSRNVELVKVFKQLLLLTKKMIREKARDSFYGSVDADEARFHAICANWKRFSGTGKKSAANYKKDPLDIVRLLFSQPPVRFDGCKLDLSSDLSSCCDHNIYGSSISFGSASQAGKERLQRDFPKLSVSSSSPHRSVSQREERRCPTGCSLEEQKLDSLGLLTNDETRRCEVVAERQSTPSACSQIAHDELTLHELFEKYPQFKVEGKTCAVVDVIDAPRLESTKKPLERQSDAIAHGSVTNDNYVDMSGQFPRFGTCGKAINRRKSDDEQDKQSGITRARSEENLTDATCFYSSSTAFNCSNAQSAKKKSFSSAFTSLKRWSTKLAPGNHVQQSAHVESPVIQAKPLKLDEMTPAQVHETYIQGVHRPHTLNPSHDTMTSELPTCTKSTALDSSPPFVESPQSTTFAASPKHSLEASTPVEAPPTTTIRPPLPRFATIEQACASRLPVAKMPSFTIDDKSSDNSLVLVETMESVSSAVGERICPLNRASSSSKETLAITLDMSANRSSPAPSEVSKTESALSPPSGSSDVSKTESSNQLKKITVHANPNPNHLTTVGCTLTRDESGTEVDQTDRLPASSPNTLHQRVIGERHATLADCEAQSPSLAQEPIVNRDVKKPHYIISGVKSKRTLRKKKNKPWYDLSDDEETLSPEKYHRQARAGEEDDEEGDRDEDGSRHGVDEQLAGTSFVQTNVMSTSGLSA